MWNTNEWYGRAAEICMGPRRPPAVDFAAELERIHRVNEALFREIQALEPDVYSTVRLRDLRAIDVAGMKPVIDRHFPLADLAGAFRHQQSGAHFGKIVVDI